MSALGEYPGTWPELSLPRDHTLPLQFQEKLSLCILLMKGGHTLCASEEPGCSPGG